MWGADVKKEEKNPKQPNKPKPHRTPQNKNQNDPQNQANKMPAEFLVRHFFGRQELGYAAPSSAKLMPRNCHLRITQGRAFYTGDGSTNNYCRFWDRWNVTNSKKTISSKYSRYNWNRGFQASTKKPRILSAGFSLIVGHFIFISACKGLVLTNYSASKDLTE